MAELKEIVRVGEADLDGKKPIFRAIQKIKGISFMMANAICNAGNFDPNRKIGTLSEDEIRKLEDIMKNPGKYGIPSWLLNRRKDLETGKDIHLIGPDVEFKQRSDIKRMIDMKCYKGVRHMLGLKVRGQRTRSTGRKGRTVGVIRKKTLAKMKKKGA
jgi:small subunit ribosomal protein S13